MAWIFDTYSMNKGYSVLSVVTGKPLSVGGSLGRENATGRGVVFCLQEALARSGQTLEGQKVVVQGFGNVGSGFARIVSELGAHVIAISDSSGGIVSEGGIDVAAAIEHKRAGGRIADLGLGEPIANDELLLLPCDVLAPCALEQALTAANAAGVRARIVVEGANAPTTPDADAILEADGVLVIPDILANAGGVVVSYFEWVQGLQELFWKEDEVNRRLNEIVTRAFAETWDLHESRDISLRLAAYGLGIQRVAEATIIRGLFPVSEVTVYTARDCHLCARAREQLEQLRLELGFEVREVDIGGVPELERAYREWIPVVELGGERVSVYRDEGNSPA